MSEKRGSFSGKIGFILTAAAAAIGLGCVWRFPTHVADCGGGLYIILYLFFLALFGIPMIVLEFAIGRKTGSSAVRAFAKLNPKFKFLGILAFAACAMIQPFFSVLGGAITKFSAYYLQASATLLTGQGTPETFSVIFSKLYDYVFGLEPIVWTGIFVFLTGIIAFFGVQKGIERLCKILLPIEAVILVVLAVYVMTIPGIADGIIYYFTPNFSALSPYVVLTAIGQVFFSLSLGMGIMLTLGSYTSKNENLVSSALTTTISTFCVALIAGLIIVPVSFLVTGGDPAIIGTGNMFLSMVAIFSSMQYGCFVGAAFFVLLFFSALLVNVCSLEAMVCVFQEKWAWSRPKAVTILTIATFLIAIPISLHNGILSGVTLGGMDLLEMFDFVSGTILLPIVIFLTCICVGYFTNTQSLMDEIKLSSKFKHEKPYVMLIRFVIPIVIGAVFVFGIITALC